MQQTDFPRTVVVAANPLGTDACTGVMTRSLFVGWPRERLFQVFFPVGVTYRPDLEMCQQYRSIRTSGIVRCYDAAQADLTSGIGLRGSFAGFGSRFGLSGVSLLQKLKGHPRLTHKLRFIQECWYAFSWIGKILERQLRELQPDIVYAHLGNYCLTKITCAACERLGIPMFIHVTDDFVTSLYAQMPFSTRLQAASDRSFRHAVAYAHGLAAISPVMAEEYRRRYEKQWSWFTTLIDADAYDPSPRPADGVIRLVYAGNLALERWRPLRKLALAIQALRNKQGIDAQLEIYAPPEQINAYRRELHVPQASELRDWLPAEELPRVFHDADILVHAESFDPALANYTQFSFSTKLSQYMMAGRCILMFGPEEIGSSQMVRIADAGLRIGTNESQSLTDALQRLLVDRSLRERCGQNGRLYAMKWFESQSGRERFRNVMLETMERSREKRS